MEPVQDQRIYEFGHFRLDCGQRVVRRDAKVLPLTPKMVEILMALVERAGEVVNKDSLMQRVWPDTFVEENNLTYNISLLRKVLRSNDGSHTYIETLPRRGYRFSYPVSLEASNSRDSAEHSVTPPELPDLTGSTTVCEPAWSKETVAESQALLLGQESRDLGFQKAEAKTGGSSRQGRSGNVEIPPWTLWAGGLTVLFLTVVSAVVWLRLQGPKQPKLSVLIPSPLTTYPGQENQPVLSPDGREVAFCWVGEQQNNFDIYRKIVGTESLLRLTSNPAQDTSPAWSPDGRMIAFHRNTGKDCGFYVIPALGGPERKIATSLPTRAHFRGRTVDWMPDGRSVVVVDRDSEYSPFHISVVSIESGEHRLLISPRPRDTGVMGIAVSPNGREVAFVATNPGTPETARRNSDLYVVSSSGGEPRRLTHDEGWIRGIAWLADGTELLFASNRTNDPSFTTTSPLWRIGASGGVPEPIPVDFVLGYEAANPHVSKHGSFVYERRERWIKNIWKGPGPAASDRGPAARLIESTWPDDSPQFSPDGQRIAFTSARSGVPEIWVCDANGSNSQQLTFMERGAFNPRWLPDGVSISFDSPQNGSHDIYVVNSDGGQKRRLTWESSDDRLSSASSDGQWLYFASNRTGRWEVWKVPVQGGSSVQVTKNGGFEAFESFDGNALYFTKHRGLEWTFGKSSLWKLPLGDSAAGETLALPEIDMGYWSVLTTGICYMDSTRDELPFPIRFFDFATQQQRNVGEISNEPMWNAPSFSVSSDGQSILFTRRPSEERDLMIVENLGKAAEE
jgi:Tol biopolymer transport system component/DNA-binding winged helix-turn-helix (wHTH) protein